MTKRMLIDATHPEETRVVVVDREQLVDFDFESSTKTQLKGNVYLAKVTRVEPSLQAAFVEYGGNRHGFLAFSEIHPDYYQIPQADRALLERLEREAAQADQDIEPVEPADPSDQPQPETDASAAGDDDGADEASARADGDDDEPAPPLPEAVREDSEQETDDVANESARQRARLLRSYKIQEVIKRRQILLVQVVKEERGNKGAALTTYLSLAGRYCVLMPNTPRGGGISRKITNLTDRRRLKTIVQSLDVPQGMGLIVRTAGQERNKAELRRDYDYLLRQWSDIRDITLESVAPALIYQEGDLIKRAMRDLYSRDIEEVLVEGDEGYRSAKRLMQMMMPSHARRIKPYKDELPLFYRYKVEDQLDGMHSPVVQLPSGGSIVIHTTEALTAIDVNSGRSTRERHIDETALKTNLEAADEAARQLRLRDLAGLIVIDFIDMGEHRHQRQVERRLRDALKLDRARLQVGRISMFGLLELSRQRLRASLQELSSQSCPVCQGLGVVRSTESCALHALRRIQEAGIRNEASVLQLNVPADVALYLLNQKRDTIVHLEERYRMQVLVNIGRDLLPSDADLEIVERRPQAGEEEEAGETRDSGRERKRERVAERDPRRDGQDRVELAATGEDGDDDETNRKRRRRRRRRRRDDETEGETAGTSPADAMPADDGDAGDDAVAGHGGEQAGGEQAGGESGDEAPRRRRRRRGRRGARNERDDSETGDAPDQAAAADTAQPSVDQAEILLAKLQQITAIGPGTAYMTAPMADAASVEPGEQDPQPVDAQSLQAEASDDGRAGETVLPTTVEADAFEPPQLLDAASSEDLAPEPPADTVAAASATLPDDVAAAETPVTPLAVPPVDENADDDETVAQQAHAAPEEEEDRIDARDEPPLAANAADHDQPQPGLSEDEAGSARPAQPERKGWWSRWVR